MIKANEIRIGNIYNRKHGKGWTETIITEEIMGKIFSNDKEYALNDFEDIPISIGLLQSLGTVIQYTNGLRCFRISNLPLGLYFLIAGKGQCHICLSYFDGINYIDLHARAFNIHQLQYLYYSFTGEELEIKL